MNILVIESSPHKKGSSNLLAEYFIQGAEEAGHKVAVFDAARADLHPCMGCDACGMSGPCCQKDDMAGLREQILKTDMMVLVTRKPSGKRCRGTGGDIRGAYEGSVESRTYQLMACGKLFRG